MGLFKNITGITKGVLQLALGGVKIKNSAGVFEARNAADAAYAIGRGAAPVGGDDWVTKTYGDANYLDAAAESVRSVVIPVTQSGGATQDSTAVIPAGAVMHLVIVDVTTAWDGAGATLDIGDTATADLYMDDTDMDVDTVDKYTAENFTATTATVLRATVAAGGGTLGVAKVIAYYSTPAA